MILATKTPTAGKSNKLWLQALFALSLLTLQPGASEIKLGFLLPYNVSANMSGGSSVTGNDYESAVLLAVEAINSSSSLFPGEHVTFIRSDTQCNEKVSLNAMLSQLGKGVQAFIGPACTCETQAKLAAAINIPMISYMCTNERLSDKTLFPTFVRTIPPISRLAPPVHALMRHFNWTRVGILSQNTHRWSQWHVLVNNLRGENLVVSTVQTMVFGVHYNESGLTLSFEKLLQTAAKESRVVILAMNYALAGQAVNFAGKLGLNQGFAFVMFDLDLDLTGNTKKNLSATWSKDWDERAFQSTLLLSVNNNVSKEYLTFVEDVKRNRTGSLSQAHTSSIYAAYLYDAVFQYAIALNKTGKPVNSDGREIIQYLMGRQFRSILGYDRFINSDGNAEFNLVLMDYRANNNGIFQEVGEFIIDSLGKQKLVLSNELIIWPDNSTAPSSEVRKCRSCKDRCYNDGNLTIGLILPYKVGSPDVPPGNRYASALKIAVDRINRDPTLLPGITLSFIWDDSECLEELSIQALIEQWEKRVDGFIGFGCGCSTQARMAAALNLPVISHMCTSNAVSDKELYPTFARTIFGDNSISPSVLAILKYFNWNRVGIISEDADTWESRGDFLVSYLKSQGKIVSLQEKVKFHWLYKQETDGEHFQQVLMKMKTKARIIILSLERRLIREGMYYASKLGMNNGDYAFIAFQLDPLSVQKFFQRPKLWFIGEFKATRDLNKDEEREFYDAFKSVLLLTVNTQQIDKYYTFVNEVKHKMSDPPFCSKTYVGSTKFQNLTVYNFNRTAPIVTGYLYDATYLYAIGVNRTLAQGGNATNGRAVMKNLFGRQFSSILGYDVFLDEQGDVQQNLTVMTLSDNTGEPYFAYKGMFSLEGNNNQTQHFQLYPNATIEWINGAPPVDEPECGFDNEKCIETQGKKLSVAEIVSICLGVTVVVILFGGAVFYRKQKLEKELASDLWRVNYNEISLRARGAGSLRSQVSLVSAESFDNINARQLFTLVGSWRSNTVAIKKLNKTSLDLTREIKMELKQMRDIRHDNLTQFMGACVDTPNICILFQYCPKGSLQDILENEDVKLDNMFVTSLVTDIVKGMSYLHSTDVKSHGNLKSSNCVVDGRWVLKITDYGLNKFKADQTVREEGEYARFYRMIWTAPELIRAGKEAPSRGTQKGDVYSFAIICQELLTRSGPFDMCYYHTEPKEVVQRVMMRESPPFRPKFNNIVKQSDLPGLRQITERCWNEQPEARPDFEDLRRQIRKMSVGRHTNIMDNMVNMLEKYANNLESLVEERTSQLADEKRKTENLLHRMLPPPVARDLVHGKTIVPEKFDEVSIFFSDIVGFTSLSSESTPFQVVELLNDLYTLFDDIISNYDVYKVETIGDAYMVVSGLPIRNGHQHAGEVASMALHMRKEIYTFKTRHRPNEQLKLRIGIHSGPVVAGVVGNTMPRYCLFGDTVNTASRMESNGEALKIHISSDTKSLLDHLGGYHIQERGEVFLKGKGTWITFWLEGSNLAPRVHGGLHKDKHCPKVVPAKRRESRWALVKELLPKLTKQAQNGTLPPVKIPSTPKKCVQLPPIS